MTIAEMRYGFLDESGGVDPFSGSHFLVVAMFTTNMPRPIELHVKRARKSLRRKARPDEMKATVLEQRVIERLLRSIADEDVEIVVVLIDKRAILRPPEDPEDIYREAVTRAIVHCVKRWPRIELFLDKLYILRGRSSMTWSGCLQTRLSDLCAAGKQELGGNGVDGYSAK